MTASQKECFMVNSKMGRAQGSQKKRYKDSLKSSLKAFNIDYDSWEQKALDRPKWRSSIVNGFKSYKKNRKTSAEQKRQARKARANNPTNDAINFPCLNCKRTFCARIYQPRMTKMVLIEFDGQHTQGLGTGLYRGPGREQGLRTGFFPEVYG